MYAGYGFEKIKSLEYVFHYMCNPLCIYNILNTLKFSISLSIADYLEYVVLLSFACSTTADVAFISECQTYLS